MSARDKSKITTLAYNRVAYDDDDIHFAEIEGNLNIPAEHVTLGNVTILRLLPQELPITLREPGTAIRSGLSPFWPADDPVTDELYYRQALVEEINGNKDVVPLRELALSGKPLIQHVLDFEACDRFKKTHQPAGKLYLHSYYGVVEVIKHYSETQWLCRINHAGNIESDTHYPVNFDQFSNRHRLLTQRSKVFHPSELTPLEQLKKMKPVNEYLYAGYSDVPVVAETKACYKIVRKKKDIVKGQITGHSTGLENRVRALNNSTRQIDNTMKGLDEFVRILANLPRPVKTKKIGGGKNKFKTVKYREAPRVVAVGEDTGRYYITPAWMLFNITNGRRYRWQDPSSYEVPEPPTWFTYDPASEDPGYNGNLAEVPEIIEKDKTTPQAVYMNKRNALTMLLEKKAWYWQQPPTTARQFGISKMTIRWSKPPLMINHPLALIGFTYNSNNYSLPVYISPNSEISVKTRNREVGAFLCRYVLTKLAEALGRSV